MADSFGPLAESPKFRQRSKNTAMSLVTLFVLMNTLNWKLPTLQDLLPLLVMVVPASVVAPAAVVELPPLNWNSLGVHLGVGYEFDAGGNLGRRDVINRTYKVEDRTKWYVDMSKRS